MAWKEKVAAVAAVGAMVVGGSTYLGHMAPQTTEQRRQDQVGQLVDSQEKANERLRQEGDAAADADRLNRGVPGERRLPEPPHFRLRLP